MRIYLPILCGSLLLILGCGDESPPGSADSAPATSAISGSTQESLPAAYPPAAAAEHPEAEFNTEEYAYLAEHGFQTPQQAPLSTFSIDVDTASYSNVRRMLQAGQLPPAGAVRLEELINYFPYAYPQPETERPFGVNSEVATCPWAPEHRLLRIGIQGKVFEASARPHCNLVFLVDASGSMASVNKLPLVKQSLEALVEQLDGRDHVAIVVYAGSSGVVLQATPGDRKHQILSAIEHLQSGGSTNGEAGIETAYELASRNFDPAGVNRIILCTDGDFNIGQTSADEVTRLIQQKRESGVSLSVLGFGMGNLKDHRMEQLADHGNGNYAYLDTFAEARKVLVEQLAGTLITIAKDVKIQVEFNPAQVAAYRLIGYENRTLAAKDFLDDYKDAGEIGAGHAVTALYEIVPAGAVIQTGEIPPLRYQTETQLSANADSNELLTLRLRYKDPATDAAQTLEFRGYDLGHDFESASRDFRFIAAVAAFGMQLRNSEFKANTTWDQIQTWATAGLGDDPQGYRHEFLELLQQAKQLTDHDS